MFDCLTGGTFNPQKPISIDGFDVWNTISRGEVSPRTEILLNIDNPPQNGAFFQGMALRMGNMKLMMNVPNITCLSRLNSVVFSLMNYSGSKMERKRTGRFMKLGLIIWLALFHQ